MYPALSKPASRALETMYFVIQTQSYVLSTLDTMNFHQKLDKKVESPQ